MKLQLILLFLLNSTLYAQPFEIARYDYFLILDTGKRIPYSGTQIVTAPDGCMIVTNRKNQERIWKVEEINKKTGNKIVTTWCDLKQSDKHWR